MYYTREWYQSCKITGLVANPMSLMQTRSSVALPTISGHEQASAAPDRLVVVVQATPTRHW
jgi:hypothetical protein